MSKEKNSEKFDELVEEEAKKPRGELFCSKCGSSRLHYFVGLGGGNVYVCKDCGYMGPVAIEDGKIADELRKEWEKGKK